MADPLLTLTRLDAHYNDFQALFGIDFDIAEGEVVAIIGSNGAGKSTLMRSISGLITNGASQISYRGEQIGALRADQIAERESHWCPRAASSFHPCRWKKTC